MSGLHGIEEIRYVRAWNHACGKPFTSFEAPTTPIHWNAPGKLATKEDMQPIPVNFQDLFGHFRLESTGLGAPVHPAASPRSSFGVWSSQPP